MFEKKNIKFCVVLYVGPTKSSPAVCPIPINGHFANQNEMNCVFLNTLYIELHNN